MFLHGLQSWYQVTGSIVSQRINGALQLVASKANIFLDWPISATSSA